MREEAMKSPQDQAVPGEPPGALSLSERRTALRLLVDGETSCHLVAGVGETLWPARVVNLSSLGICLRLSRPFEPGAAVLLELANGVRIFSCVLVMRVVHVAPQEDGSYLLAGEFTRKLTQRELMALLA